MLALLNLFLGLAFDWCKPRRRLEIENLYLHHQLNRCGGFAGYYRKPGEHSCAIIADVIAVIDLCVVHTVTLLSLWAPPAALVRCDPASDGRMVGTTDHRGIPMEYRASLLGPGQ